MHDACMFRACSIDRYVIYICVSSIIDVCVRARVLIGAAADARAGAAAARTHTHAHIATKNE